MKRKVWKTIRIQSPEDVVAFTRDIRTGKRRKTQNFQVRLNDLPDEDAIQISKKINENYFACGCKEGTILGFIGLAAGVYWLWTSNDALKDLSVSDFIYVFGAMVVGIGIGKFYGKLMAKNQLKKVVNMLQKYEPESLKMGRGDGTALCGMGHD